MADRTETLAEPARLILTVAEPRRATARLEVRVVGLGREGRHLWLVTEDGRRIRRDHIQGVALPGGGPVDPDTAIRALQGLAPLPEDPNSFGSHMTRFGVGMLLTPVLGAVAAGVYVLGRGAVTVVEALQIALILFGVPVAVAGVWVVVRGLREAGRGFGRGGPE